MSSYSSDASRSGSRSPLFGTATFSTMTQSESSPTRYSYSSRSGISSDDSDISGNDMRRITVSPLPPNRHSGSDLHSWSEDDSIRDDAEVEAALSALDNELDRTEDALTEWSHGSSVTPSSYLSGSASSPSLTSSSSIYIPFTNTLRDARILSTITERTENPSSRPTSYNLSVPGSRPVSDAIRRSTVSLHSRGVTEPASSTSTSSRRTGDLIAFFEDKSTSSDSSSRSFSPHGHRRAGSVPAGPRSPSPYTQTSQSIPTFGTTSYGYGGSSSRPSSPTKSWVSQSQSYTSSTPSRSFLSPPPRSSTTGFESKLDSPYTSSETPTNSNTFTSTSYGPTSTNATTQITSLKRPQTSPRSPLTSVRNVVAAWKSRSPSIDNSSQVGSTKSSTDATPEEGFFSIRRRASRGFQRERALMGGESGSSTFGRSGSSYDQEDFNVPSTPRTSTSLTPSGIVPPPFDLTELGTFAKGSQEPLRIGLLWYLNVHAPPPYRWQRCQAVLYPNMLLLSWIAQGGGRGIVTLDLLNCTEVRSVASPTHPSAQDDVGTIAARAQTANAQAEGFGELGLVETLCPFQLFYGDGVERLGAESARERVRWVSAIWEVLDRSVTVPDRSETQSPTGSMRTIRSMASTSTHSGSAVSGSRSTTFLPPMESIPDFSDFQSFSGSSVGSLSRQPSLRSRAVDDAAISNQTIVYPGDPRVIAPSRSSSLRRTSSLTDLDEEFESALQRAKDARPGLGFGLGLAGAIVGEGSPVTVSSGPTLRRDIIVTPPPSAGRGASRARAVGSDLAASVSDDAFFSSGARTSGEQSTSYSLSSHSETYVTTPLTDTSSSIPTEETSGSGTVVPLTYQREGTSHLDSSAGAGRSAFTSDSLSRTTGLTRSRAVRTRRDGASSVSYSSSSLSGLESSDRENTSRHNHSRSHSEYSRSDDFSTLESNSRSTYTRSANGTPPLPSSSSGPSSSSSDRHPSTTDTPTTSTSTTPYETARSPSIMSFASLPSIPSLYETAEVCSTESETAKSVSSGDFITAKASPKAESVSDYITAPVCESEPTSPFTTAEICPTEVSTEYDDAECRCKPEKVVVSEGIQVAEPELVKEVITEPVEPIVPLPREGVVPPTGEDAVIAMPLPPAVEDIPVPPPGPAPEPEPEPAVVEELIPGPPVTYIRPGFLRYPRDTSTISSPSDLSVPSIPTPRTARDVPLPESSVSSPSLLSTELSTERSAMLPQRPPSAARSIRSIASLPGPSPIGPPETLPTTTMTTTSVTESTPSTVTPRVPSSPSIRESLWAPETDDTYESSILRASPSVQSVAFPEGPDISFDTSFLRPTASAYTSREQSRLSTIVESLSSESPSITYSSSSSPSLTPTGSMSVSVSASATPSSPSPPPTAPSPSLQVPPSTTVVSPVLSPERSSVPLTRTPSTVSTVSSISMRSDMLGPGPGSLYEEPILEDVSTEPSLLSTHRSYISRAISPAHIPLPGSPSLLATPAASVSVSMTSPRGSTPSIQSDLITIPSERTPPERVPSERPPSERPSVIITDDINRLLQYLHGLEGDRQRDNQGVHDHLGEIQNELRNLADYIHEKEAPTPVLPLVQYKDHSVGGSSVISLAEPRGAPQYPEMPLTVTDKAGPRPVTLSPPPSSPRSPSTLSSSISFLSSHHSDDLSLMEGEPFLPEPSSLTPSTSISSSPPSSSIPSSPSSSPSSRTLPLTPISHSPLSSGEYLSRTSTEVTRRDFPTAASPTPSVVSSATVRPGIDRDALNRIRDVVDGVKAQTDALRDGQLSTNDMLDELRQRCPVPQDNSELVERLQRLEDLINRLADAQRRARGPTPEESLFDSGSDTSTAIRRLRERWERMRGEPPTLLAPTPLRPRTSLDDMMAELLRPPQPSALVQIQPPPAFVPLNFRPDARGPRPRSASPTLPTEFPPLRPHTVPLAEPFVTRDLGRRRPSRAGRPPPRPGAPVTGQVPPLPPLPPSEMPVTRADVGRRPRVDDTGPDFLDGVHRQRVQRRPGADGWIQPRQEGEPAVPPAPAVPPDDGRATAPGMIETRPWYQAPPPPPQAPQIVQPGVGPMPPPFTQSVILPPIFNDMMAMVRENRFMHLASLEQQRELMRYMNSLNDWLGHDVEDRQAELRGVSARIDQLHDDLNRLTRGPFPPPGPGLEPGGFIHPGQPGPPGAGIIRPGTVPASSTYPPHITFPQPTPYAGVVPPVVPHGYRTPTPSESPVFPSPPSREGDMPFVPPDLGPSRASVGLHPQVYQPPIPPEGEDYFVPPEPSYRTESLSTESPRRSPSLLPVPGPQHIPGGPPIFVHPPSQVPTRRTSYDRSETPTPPPQQLQPPVAGQPTIINIPGATGPGVPMAPSTQPPFDFRDQPVLAPPMAPYPMGQPSRRTRSESPEFDERRGQQQPGQPIIIHPAPQSMTPGPLGPPILPGGPQPVILEDTRRSYSRSRSRSTTPSRSRSRSRSRSPRRSSFMPAPGFQPPMMGAVPPTMMAPPPFGPGMMGTAPMPFGGPPVPQQVTVMAPSRRPSEYRSPTPESRSPSRRAPSRAASRYSDRDRFEPGFQPAPVGGPMPMPFPATHIGVAPYPSYPRSRGTRYSGSRTPPSERDRSESPERRRRRRRGRRSDYSRSPSLESDERESRRRGRSRYDSPSRVYQPAPGPEYGGVGPVLVPGPPGATHVHLPQPGSPTRTSFSRTYSPEREAGPPLPHPYPPSSQYPPPSQYLPLEEGLVGRAPSGRTRPSRAPTIVEVSGPPEPIQVLPPPLGRPRTESAPYQPPISGPVSGEYGEERPISPSLESQIRGASPSRPFVPFLPSEGSRRTGRPPFPPIGEVPEPGTYGHIRPESGTPVSEEAPYGFDEEAPYGFDEEPRAVPAPGESRAPRAAPGDPRAAPAPGVSRAPTARTAPGDPRGAPEPREGEFPEPATGGHIRPASGDSRAAPVPVVSRTSTARTAPGEPRGAPEPREGEIPEPATWGHIRPESSTQPSEGDLGEYPRGAPGPDFPRGAPELEFMRGAPGPEVSRAPTTRGAPRVGPRIPSGPDRLEYDDAERARYERFADMERQLADATQDAAEAEMRREHDFDEREAERARRFEDNEARRNQLLSTLPRQPVAPPGAPLPGEELEVPSERAESVVTSIRRAAAESAARHADELRDIVQGEREEMARQLQAEREEARVVREALEQQMLGERKRADDERDARVRELEEELTRVRAELDNEKRQRDHDEDMRRETESQRNQERDDEMRQQLSEITDLLLAHREEFARKKELVDERWEEKQTWRNETNEQFEGLRRMVQHMIETCTEEKERCEEERRAAADRPTTQHLMDELQRLREIFDTLTNTWREETERQHAELLDTVRSTANVQIPFNVQAYLDEFSKSLAAEVRMLLGEVGKLREERRNLQFEIGTLLCLRSKYDPGGMFDPDWKPPSVTPLVPQQPGGGDLPPEPPAPPPEHRPGGWRPVPQRGGGFRRLRKKSGPRPGPVVEAPPPPMAPPPERVQTTGSWATWQMQPGVEYTPPSTEPDVHLAPEVQPSPRLFGPRTPPGRA